MEDDEYFLQHFLERAKQRQRLLESTEPTIQEEKEEEEDESRRFEDKDREENVSPANSDLNYSSDLSLSDHEIFRAEPVVCHSSPDQHLRTSIDLHSKASSDQESRISFDQQLKSLPDQQLKTSSDQCLNTLPPDQQLKKSTSSHSLPISTNEEMQNELQLKVDRAEQTKFQLRKLVEISKNGSKEHIEAARLLQIAEIEHLNLTNHIAMFKQGMRKKSESLGSTKISNIRLKISPKLRNDLADDGVTHNFFCVLSYGPDVKATEIIDTNHIRKQDLKAHLQFTQQITFVDLPPDFIIKLEVFELVVGQHLPKLLSRLTPSKRTKITPDSNFKRIGSLKLTITDRDQTYKNLTQWSKHEESKFIERECKFHMELKPEQLPHKAGMLHVRCLDGVGRPDWSRFWVDSSSGQIRFWKSKQHSLDDKKPNQVLEFRDLCSPKIQKLTPDDDLYRQNSLVFYSLQKVEGGEKNNLFQRVLKEDPKYKIVKHQLAADNKEERDSWCAILDHSLNCFREWHGKIKIYSQEEIKELFLS